MPIFYNFHILLATFYTIYWTNILIQCLVLVPVLCMFFISQNIHIKRSPNAINFYELFWNICDFWEVESSQTGAHSHHKTLECALGPRRAMLGSNNLECPLEIYFGCKESYIQKKIMLKSQRNRSYGSPGI